MIKSGRRGERCPQCSAKATEHGFSSMVKVAKTKNLLASDVVYSRFQQIERREWWLWACAVLVTLLSTLGTASFLSPVTRRSSDEFDNLAVHPAIRGLIGLVLLFDIYTVYQQFQIVRIRRQVIEQEKLFRLITENAGDMIAVVDVDGNRLYTSPSYQRVLGYSQEELRTTRSFEQIHPEDVALVQDAASEAWLTGVGRRIEYRMRHRDRSWIYLESTASAIRGDDGDVQKLVIVNRDITARRKLEEQFRQAQKMEAVGRLSGGIAHDFNNLLGVIIGYAEMMRDQQLDLAPRHEAVQEILKAGRRAASLTRQLLAFSRQQVLEPKALNLNDIVVDTERMLRRVVGEDIEFETRFASDLGTVKADPGQIEQILMNLVVNARDAMPEGGKLLIETSNAVMDETAIRRYSYAVKTGAYTVLTVSDNGVGMDTETQAHIFEPFFTTKGKDQGTGLGLATVYGVVKQSGGYIDVFSELGRGTTFKLFLPRVDDPVKPQLAAVDAAGPLAGDETILLVEDEAALRALAHNVLQSLGYHVLQASSPAEAIAIAERTPHIDLLLTDVVMPGLNGKSLAEKLRCRYSDMRVIYMSGYTGQGIGNNQSVYADGVFVAKPFTRKTLAQKIRQALSAGALSLSS